MKRKKLCSQLYLFIKLSFINSNLTQICVTEHHKEGKGWWDERRKRIMKMAANSGSGQTKIIIRSDDKWMRSFHWRENFLESVPSIRQLAIKSFWASTKYSLGGAASKSMVRPLGQPRMLSPCSSTDRIFLWSEPSSLDLPMQALLSAQSL